MGGYLHSGKAPNHGLSLLTAVLQCLLSLSLECPDVSWHFHLPIPCVHPGESVFDSHSRFTVTHFSPAAACSDHSPEHSTSDMTEVDGICLSKLHF